MNRFKFIFFIVGLLVLALYLVPINKPEGASGVTPSQYREKLADTASMLFGREGDSLQVTAEGPSNVVLVFHDEIFKYGTARRQFLQSLLKTKKIYCDAGFVTVSLKEGFLLGNEDSWSLECPKQELIDEQKETSLPQR